MSELKGAQAVEWWPVDRLLPSARNARKHGARQIELIGDSIRRFGFNVPVLATAAGEIIAGHGRVLGARHISWPRVPVIVCDHMSDAERRAFMLADNKLAELSDWDLDVLSSELQDLEGLGVYVGGLGFNLAELEQQIAKLTAPDASAPAAPGATPAPAAPGEPPAPATLFDAELPAFDPRAEEVPQLLGGPVSRPGDLWQLGPHRVMCGDSTDAATVARLLAGAPAPVVMVTDPPYGVKYDPAWRQEFRPAVQREGKVENDDRADWREAWSLFPGDVAYVWHAGTRATEVDLSLQAAGFACRYQIIWNKPHFALGRGDYHWQHEPCWYAVRAGAVSRWQGGRKQTTVWNIRRHGAFGGGVDDADTDHGTQKPLECMRRPLLNHTAEGEAVYDPFLGSGTTLIAAELSGRVCLGLELSPAYVDVIVERWRQFTGLEAVLGDSSLTFGEARAEGRRAA